MSPRDEPIPNTFHFVWFGKRLPFFALLAIRSALRRNENSAAILWHGRELSRDAGLEALRDEGLTLRPIDVEVLVDRAQSRLTNAARAAVALSKVKKVYEDLSAPAARSNLIRLLVLFAEGGVYLDTDTLSLRGLGELRQSTAFCGREHILWPKRRLDRLSAYYWTKGPVLEALRALGSWLPEGYALYWHTLRWYEKAINNAVLGFAPGHPLLLDAFERVAELGREESLRRYRLGTHLLQEVIARQPGEGSVQLLDPEYFYPLGPVISAHYFKPRDNAAEAAQRLLSARTHVVHWYSSVSNLLPLDEAYIRAHREHSVYAHLCASVLD